MLFALGARFAADRMRIFGWRCSVAADEDNFDCSTNVNY
jgi:hypothetical protein